MEDNVMVTFRAYVSYGKMDSLDYEVEVELTEEEYERLKKSCSDHWRMRDDEAISDIYDKAYKAALKLDIDVMRRDKRLLTEKMEWYHDARGEKAPNREYTDEEIIEMLENDGNRGITYPSSLEEEIAFEDE